MTQWTNYAQVTEAKQQKWPCASISKSLNLNLSDSECDSLWSELLLPTGFFRSLPAHDDDSDTGSKLIRECSMFDWDWGSSDSDCNIKARWDPDYYKCYTIQVDPNRRQVRKFHLVVQHNLCCNCCIWGTIGWFTRTAKKYRIYQIKIAVLRL
jgi:hypothetical protein